jgi:hypothetical protein
MKKTYIKWIYKFLFLALIASACEQNITLDLPKYDEKVAVYCILSPNTIPKMYLNLSKSYYNYGDTTDKHHFIKTARVIITDQTKNVADTLKLDSSMQGFGFTWFYQGKHPCIAGNHYIANILYNGKIINAETTISFPVNIDHVTYKKIAEFGPSIAPMFEIHAFFNDMPGVANNYNIKCEGSPTNSSSNNFFISDLGLNGKQMEIISEYQPSSNIPDSFRVYLYLGTSSETTGNYFNDISTQSYNGSDPFAEPVIIRSNINGGLGVFGSIAYSQYFFLKVK